LSRVAPRLVALLAAALTAACVDAPTSAVAPNAARLALTPRFPAREAAIFQGLGAFAVVVDRVRLTIYPLIGGDARGTALMDTTIAFPADQQELRVVIDVPMVERTQQLHIQIALLEGTTKYFEGLTTLTARAGETSAPPSPVQMTYVGPGATAAFLSLNYFQPTLAPSSSLQFVITAYDAGERVVTGLPITWTSSDANVLSVSTSGLVSSTGKLGTATITARALNGLFAETSIDVEPVARLALLQGDKQSALVGLVLPAPFAVQTVSAAGQPVAGVSITFSADSAGGSVGNTTVLTDAYGTASTTITLGTVPGAYSFRAQVTGLPNIPPVIIGASALTVAVP
jgi:hypothetical protein